MPSSSPSRSHHVAGVAWAPIRSAAAPLGLRDFTLVRCLGAGDIGPSTSSALMGNMAAARCRCRPVVVRVCHEGGGPLPHSPRRASWSSTLVATSTRSATACSIAASPSCPPGFTPPRFSSRSSICT
ncbi:hypothetical protein EE612_059962 [Oryza sativa]|nr:hypothetical protein EE612_059962 [Oryza sativa]